MLKYMEVRSSMLHVTRFKILDTFHDDIYKERGVDPQFVFSDNPCFGDTPFERLSNFFMWCQAHHVNLQDIMPLEYEGV